MTSTFSVDCCSHKRILGMMTSQQSSFSYLLMFIRLILHLSGCNGQNTDSSGLTSRSVYNEQVSPNQLNVSIGNIHLPLSSYNQHISVEQTLSYFKTSDESVESITNSINSISPSDLQTHGEFSRERRIHIFSSERLTQPLETGTAVFRVSPSESTGDKRSSVIVEANDYSSHPSNGDLRTMYSSTFEDTIASFRSEPPTHMSEQHPTVDTASLKTTTYFSVQVSSNKTGYSSTSFNGITVQSEMALHPATPNFTVPQTRDFSEIDGSILSTENFLILRPSSGLPTLYSTVVLITDNSATASLQAFLESTERVASNSVTVPWDNYQSTLTASTTPNMETESHRSNLISQTQGINNATVEVLTEALLPNTADHYTTTEFLVIPTVSTTEDLTNFTANDRHMPGITSLPNTTRTSILDATSGDTFALYSTDTASSTFWLDTSYWTTTGTTSSSLQLNTTTSAVSDGILSSTYLLGISSLTISGTPSMVQLNTSHLDATNTESSSSEINHSFWPGSPSFDYSETGSLPYNISASDNTVVLSAVKQNIPVTEEISFSSSLVSTNHTGFDVSGSNLPINLMPSKLSGISTDHVTMVTWSPETSNRFTMTTSSPLSSSTTFLDLFELYSDGGNSSRDTDISLKTPFVELTSSFPFSLNEIDISVTTASGFSPVTSLNKTDVSVTTAPVISSVAHFNETDLPVITASDVSNVSSFLNTFSLGNFTVPSSTHYSIAPTRVTFNFTDGMKMNETRGFRSSVPSSILLSVQSLLSDVITTTVPPLNDTSVSLQTHIVENQTSVVYSFLGSSSTPVVTTKVNATSGVTSSVFSAEHSFSSLHVPSKTTTFTPSISPIKTTTIDITDGYNFASHSFSSQADSLRESVIKESTIDVSTVPLESTETHASDSMSVSLRADKTITATAATLFKTVETSASQFSTSSITFFSTVEKATENLTTPLLPTTMVMSTIKQSTEKQTIFTPTQTVTTKPLFTQSYRIRFKGDCKILLSRESFVGEFLKTFIVESSKILKIRQESIKPNDIKCGSVILFITLVNVTSPVGKHLERVVRSGRMVIPIIVRDNILLTFLATDISIVTSPTTTMSTDLVTEPLEKVDFVVIIVAGCICALLVIIGLGVCLKECYKRKRAQSFNLLDSASMNLKLEDFTLTRIPRSSSVYTEEGVRMHVFTELTACDSPKSNGHAKKSENGTCFGDVQLHVSSRSDGMLVGVTGVSTPKNCFKRQRNSPTPSTSDPTHVLNNSTENLMYEHNRGPGGSFNPIFDATDDDAGDVDTKMKTRGVP